MDELEIQKGIVLRYHDIGNGFPIIFVHGTPSSSDEFITVINKFKNTFRVIAPDHIGFGASDKPKDYDYTIKNHQENFSKLIKHLNLKKFHIVVHDFGGIISLPFILENMNLVSSLVIMNSWAWPMSKIEYFPNWMKFLMSSVTMKFLYLKMNYSPKFFVKLAWGKHTLLTTEKHQKYIEKFKNQDERFGTWGFAQALVKENDDVWKIENQLSKLSNIPVLLLWGASDKLITLKSYEYWKKLIPNAKTKVLEKVGHFVADEAPELKIEEIENFYSK